MTIEHAKFFPFPREPKHKIREIVNRLSRNVYMLDPFLLNLFLPFFFKTDETDETDEATLSKLGS